jgi:Lrp/AsnC family transcriptional regulator for asnA, asnC and gidA
MDDIDLEIISILQHDGRTPFTEIAKTLDISEGTVRNRVARLQEQDIIQVVGLIDPYQLGFDAPAMIGVTVDPPKLESAAAQIAQFPEVSYLIMVSGEFDLIVEVMCRNRVALATFLNERLRQVPGVTRTQSNIILRTFKMALGAQPRINPSSSPGGTYERGVRG